jgi:signal transduction histidine kinase
MAAVQGVKQPDLKTLHDVAEAMVSDTQRAADIIRKLRNLFRMGKGEYSPLNLEPLVSDVLELVRSKLNEADIMLTAEFDKNLLVNGDLTQLQQVVLNLLNNAIDAMVEGRTRYPHLRLSAKAVDQYIDLQVQDNGKGVDPSRMEDVFSLFKTSKSEGMGVGLWLSRSIVETHGGRLTFESEPGHRTVFTLRLPSLPASPSA